jgi:hypothetical protein
LERKVKCKSLFDDTETDVLLTELYTKEYNEVTYDCRKCGKKFNAHQNRHRHEKICKVSLLNNKNGNEHPDISVSLREVNKIIEKKFDDFLTCIKDNMFAAGSTHNTISVGPINNNFININNTNCIPKNPRNFGHENMEALPHDFVRSCFMTLNFRPLFENLHCDPNYPENHNIRIKSTKRQQLEMFTNDKWTVTPLQNGLNEILMRLHSIFENFNKKHHSEVLEDMTEEEFVEIMDTLDEISKLSKKSDDIKKDLLCVLEENRTLLTCPSKSSVPKIDSM